MIVTSSWFVTLPPDMLRIGISRGTPRGQPAGYRRLPELSPGPWFRSVTPAEYHKLYMDQLTELNASDLVEKINKLAAGRDVALLCFESPTKAEAWCHRAHVSLWLHNTLQLDVFEYGYEAAGTGWSHPKLIPEFRR